MEFTAKEIASLISARIEGDENQLVRGFNGIESAVEFELSFIDSEKYLDLLNNSQASIILINEELYNHVGQSHCTFLVCQSTRMSLAKLLTVYQNAQQGENTISTNAVIEESAEIGKNARINAGVYIGKNVTIGDNVILHSGVRILDGSIIGDNVTIQANAVIGGDGFGFVPNSENNYFKVPHIGNVVIEDHVEIGSNTCIDRATMGSTIIRKGVKLDNLIQIAHNVEIGENTVIAAQTGIAGSAKIGKNCLIGGQVGIVGHIEIADEVKIAAQSGIGNSISEKGSIVQGSPALKIRDYKMSYVGFKKLPEILKRLDVLEKNNS